MLQEGGTYFGRNVFLHFGTLLLFTLEYRCSVTWKVFDSMQRDIAARTR